MRITGNDISVVIQGPVEWGLDNLTGNGLTYELTRSVRALLPQAEVIISTWNGSDTSGLIADEVVYTKDPGGQGALPGFTVNNVNRQIVSSRNGLLKASRPFALKIRSDMVLSSLDFLEIYNSLADARNTNKSATMPLQGPIMTNNISSRNPLSIMKRLDNHYLLFHPSDHVQFGYKEDLLQFWDLPLQTTLDATWYYDRAQPNRWRLSELSRLTPEQYIFTSFLNKFDDFSFANFADFSNDLLNKCEHYMSSLIITIPDRRFSLRFPKYHSEHHFSFEWMRRNDMHLAQLRRPQGNIDLIKNVDEFDFHFTPGVEKGLKGFRVCGSIEGAAIFGPNITMYPGRYALIIEFSFLSDFRMIAENNTRDVAVDVYDALADVVIAAGSIPVCRAVERSQVIEVGFVISEERLDNQIEFRLHQRSGIDLQVHKMLLSRSS